MAPRISILALGLCLASCYVGNTLGFACNDQTFQCPTGFYCDETGHCAEGSAPTDSGTGSDAGPPDSGAQSIGTTDAGGATCFPGGPPADGGEANSIGCPNGTVCNLTGHCESYSYSWANGIVTDNVTGLQWQQSPPSRTYELGSAYSYCSELSLGGFTWQLPTLAQLFSLVDTGSEPTIDATAFPGTQNAYYWTSDCYGGPLDCSQAGGSAWVVNFSDAGSDNTNTGLAACVRCVR